MLKSDQRAVNADLAVIVTAVLPEGIAEFGRVDGIWVASLRVWPALALALREQLIQVAFAKAATGGKAERNDEFYDYLASNRFRSRIEAIVEAFTALKGALGRERAAMTRIWAEREKQIEGVVANIARLYGEMRGIIGTSLATVPALELDTAAKRLSLPHPVPATGPISKSGSPTVAGAAGKRSAEHRLRGRNSDAQILANGRSLRPSGQMKIRASQPPSSLPVPGPMPSSKGGGRSGRGAHGSNLARNALSGPMRGK